MSEVARTVARMATWDDVRRLATALPETDEKLSWGSIMWRVRGKGFVWERPLRRTDLAQLADLGVTPPDGEILGVRVPDLAEKEVLLASDPDLYFTIPHLDGYPAVLVLLDAIGVDELEELVVEAWLDRAPKRLAAAHLADHPPARR